MRNEYAYKVRSFALILGVFLFFFTALVRICFAHYDHAACIVGMTWEWSYNWGNRTGIATYTDMWESPDGSGWSASWDTAEHYSARVKINRNQYYRYIHADGSRSHGDIMFHTIYDGWGVTEKVYNFVNSHVDLFVETEEDFYAATLADCPPRTCERKTSIFLSGCSSGEGSYNCATGAGTCDPPPCDPNSNVDNDGDELNQCQDCDDDNATLTTQCKSDRQQGCK